MNLSIRFNDNLMIKISYSKLMRTSALFLGLIISASAIYGQNAPQKYSDLIRRADSLYGAKDFNNSAKAFSDAFKADGNRATVNEHYNAACSWSLAGNCDSAFSHLYFIATMMDYNRYGHIKSDPDLTSLHSNSRWEPLLEAIKANKQKAYPFLEFLNVNGFRVEAITFGLANNQPDKPVVVFENGMASTWDVWKTVIDEVSKSNAVFAYNRPRIGDSDDDSLPPTPKHIVDNLRTMLLEKGFKPPYMLVSHSFGGAYIRSFASYYPDEVAGLVFVDPIDFTKIKDYGNLPYLEIGLSQPQIDSLFGQKYNDYLEKLYSEMPRFYVEEVKMSVQLSASDFEECNRNPLPDVPVHFLMAGGYPTAPDDRGETIFDKKKLFRIDNTIKMKRWIELINPLKYGKFIYCSNSGHYMQKDDPDVVIASIKLALQDYDRIHNEKTTGQ